MFKNPIKKYQSGGITASPQEQQQIAQLFEAASKNTGIAVETLMEAANQLQDEDQMKQYVEAISLAAQGDQTAINSIKQMFTKSASQFAKGGKLHDFICKHAKGGHVDDCGCKQDGGNITTNFSHLGDWGRYDGNWPNKFNIWATEYDLHGQNVVKPTKEGAFRLNLDSNFVYDANTGEKVMSGQTFNNIQDFHKNILPDANKVQSSTQSLVNSTSTSGLERGGVIKGQNGVSSGIPTNQSNQSKLEQYGSISMPTAKINHDGSITLPLNMLNYNMATQAMHYNQPLVQAQEDGGKVEMGSNGINGLWDGIKNLYKRYIGYSAPDSNGATHRWVRNWTDRNGQHIRENANINGSNTNVEIDINGADTLAKRKVLTGDSRFKLINLDPSMPEWRQDIDRNVYTKKAGGVVKGEKGDEVSSKMLKMKRADGSQVQKLTWPDLLGRGDESLQLDITPTQDSVFVTYPNHQSISQNNPAFETYRNMWDRRKQNVNDLEEINFSNLPVNNKNGEIVNSQTPNWTKKSKKSKGAAK